MSTYAEPYEASFLRKLSSDCIQDSMSNYLLSHFVMGSGLFEQPLKILKNSRVKHMLPVSSEICGIFVFPTLYGGRAVDQFEEAYNQFLNEQKSKATGARLERLEKIGAGERLLLRVLWQVFKSFDGFQLEYEIMGVTGAKLYIDVYYEPLGIAFECDGFVVHAELITRDRFMFERMRIRSMAMKGIVYVPFGYDELEKKPDACRRCVYQIAGSLNSSTDYMALRVQEREMLRYALKLTRKFNARDVAQCLRYGERASREMLHSLVKKQLIRPYRAGNQRHHYYVLTSHGHEILQHLR
ncbi:hypothetical protein [Paenibacillus sp. 1P07SE]|uniref:hypothetical protein n=1 Tax=Paenibacillus sp. 1P07SE TaxID=3132209 RepID=UPI0039A5B0FE